MAINTSSVNNGDTYVREDLKNSNQGSADGTSVQWYQPFLATNHTLIQFTLPSSNLGTINGIRLYLYNNGGSGGSDLNAYANNSTFTESTVTWNTAPTYSTTIIDSIDASSTSAGWRYWQLQGTGATNPLSKTWGDTISLRLRFGTQSGATKSYHFKTKESSSNQPYLEIDYTPSFSPAPMMHMMQVTGGIS